MYFQAPQTAWFACTVGLFKCPSSELFTLKETPLICISMQTILRVFLYNRKKGQGTPKSRFREAGAIPSLILLLVGADIVGSATIVTSALIVAYLKLHKPLCSSKHKPRPCKTFYFSPEDQVYSLAEGVEERWTSS